MAIMVDGKLQIPRTSNTSKSDRDPTTYRLSGAGCKGQGKGIIDYYSTVNIKGSKSNCSNDNKITGCIILPGIGCLFFMPTLLLNKVTSLFTGIKAEVYAERMNTYDFSYI